MNPALFALLAPLALLTVAGLHRFSPTQTRAHIPAIAGAAALLAFAIALTMACVVAISGNQVSPGIGLGSAALVLRLDPLSVTLFLLVSFIGAVVMRFSRNYLDGDPGQGRFFANLSLTLATVMVLVLAGNVWHLLAAWIATSLALHRLLLFYPDRPRAVAAARKKFVTARLGDLALAAAAFLITAEFGTADIGAILTMAAGPAFEASAAVTAACLLLALAALLKSAQFPTHGWLIEVMETPTPVSALLHAGIVNTGGFLVLRFADLVVQTPAALILLTAAGLATALFGCLVMLCQTSAKVALAYSTVAQMGFMLLQCGLGAFPVALVHIVAHSLYKAHAFLSAGGTAESIHGKRPAANAPRFWPVLAVPLATGALLALAFSAPPAIVALGMIIATGFGQMVTASLPGGWPTVWRAGAAAAALAATWAAVHTAAFALFGSSLPALPDLGPLHTALAVIAVAGFLAAAMLQATAMHGPQSTRWQGMRLALANGLYAHILFDRALAACLPKNAAKT